MLGISASMSRYAQMDGFRMTNGFNRTCTQAEGN
jgi:hypothetical protein